MKVLTFGEIMMRLQPKRYKRIVQADSMDIVFGGAEANVAVSLKNFGIDSSFLSKVPDNLIGEAAVRSLRAVGVDTSNILRGGDRLGIYYSEKGASQRASTVIYDRKSSAFSEMSIKELNLSEILDGVNWIHFSGITPALSNKSEKLTEEILKQAKQMGITISCDLNYRKKLWTKEKANEVMTRLMEYVDVLISNEEDCKDVFGIEASDTDITRGKISFDGYKKIARQIHRKFNISKVAFSLRESHSASTNGWSGIYYDGEYCHRSTSYILEIVDRIGGGDSFAAGIIYGILNKKEPIDIVEFAVAAAALKQSIEGDYNLVSTAEVEKLANGDSSGRVQR